MKKKDAGKTIVFMVLVCLVLGGLYFVLNQNEGKDKEKIKGNEAAQSLLRKDYDRNYPATVREVLIQHMSISQCLYNEEISDEEFDTLVTMMRKLYDEELLEKNPESSYKSNLKNEIAAAKAGKYRMSYYEVNKLSGVKYWTAEEDEFASILVCITMNNDGQIEKSWEEFLLREDEKERWKIVGWRLAEAVE